MGNQWIGIIAAASAALGTVVAPAVMSLKRPQRSERRIARTVAPPQTHRVYPFRREEERFPHTGSPAGVTAAMLGVVIPSVLLFLLVAASDVRGQWRSRVGNPTVSVSTEHPPMLPLIAEKIVLGPATGECSNEVLSALRDHFAAKGLDVVDRQNLDQILAEQGSSFSGVLDRKSVDELGRILGPSAMLTVNVTRCTAEKQRFTSSDDATVFHAKTLALLELSVQTADLATGRLFDPQSIIQSPSLQNKSEDGYPESPPAFEVEAIAFKRAARDISHMLLPQVQQRSLTFFDNEKCNLKAAYQALQSGQEERALDLSLEVLDACKTYPDPKIKRKRLQKLLANAHYNAGIMHRMRGDLDAALEYLLEAERLRPVEIMAEAVVDCREAIQARDAMDGIREEAQQAALEFQERLAAEEQARKDNTLTNSGVVDLVKMGLPEAIIVKKIETSTCEFDVSPEALVGLTEAGVGEKVIISMMESRKSDNGR